MKKTKIAFIVLIIILDVLIIFFSSHQRAIDISTNHLDGAFQTASGLYRLSDGQCPGRDFFPYIGTGMLLFLYPFFKIAGGNIAASIFSAHFVVLLAAVVKIGIVSFFISKNRKIFSIIIISSFYLIYTFIFPDFFEYWIFPGSSLRPLRAFIPYICAVAIYLSRNFQSPLKYICLGVIAGISFFWTNDFGIPSSALVILFVIIWDLVIKKIQKKNIFLLIMSAGLSYIFMLLFSTHSNALDLLIFNFIDVRNNQYWFFGGWNYNDRILSLTDLYTKLLKGIGWYAIIPILLLVYTFYKPSLKNFLLVLIIAGLFGGASVASIGGHLGYMESVREFSVLLLISVIFYSIVSKIDLFREKLPENIDQVIIPIFSFTIVSVFLLFIAVHQINTDVSNRKIARTDANRIYVEELGGYLPVKYKEYVSIARELKNDFVVEEYWGLLSAMAHNKQPLPVDSVIHALGNTKEAYISDLQSGPDYYVTTTYDFSPTWQPWNVSANWWFYQPILQSYQPIEVFPTTVLWKKGEMVEWPSVNCEVFLEDGVPYLSIPSMEEGFYEIAMEYQREELNPRSILMVRNNLNYAKDAFGYLAVDPNTTEFVFPVAARIPEENGHIFDFKLVSAHDDLTMVNVNRCTARKIEFSNPHILDLNTDIEEEVIAATAGIK